MRYIKLLLVIMWMIIIFMFSNQKAVESDKLSNGLILKTVRIIEKITHKTYSDEEILHKFVRPVRKMAHFTIYLILGILVYIFIDDLNIKNIILISLMICLIYSISDEIHQLFIEGRSGKITDVLIDTCGSFIGIIIINKIKKVIHK